MNVEVNNKQVYEIHAILCRMENFFPYLNATVQEWNEEFAVIGDDDDRLCGLVVRVPGYRSRGPGSIPRSSRFSEK
jgi:hypothetical protein